MRKLGLQDFLDRLVKRGDCVEYVGHINQNGYTNFSTTSSHRYSYSMFVGEIPEGYHVLHSCDNKVCVLPAHLRVGTNQDNANDRVERGQARGSKTENCGICGTPWDYFPGRNRCKKCMKRWKKDYRERKKNDGKA